MTCTTDFKPLITCIKYNPCSSTECESEFNMLNCILRENKFQVLVKGISDLVFIKLHDHSVSELELSMWHEHKDKNYKG